jgi:hypothetical protein
VQSQDLGFSTSRLLHVELDFRGATPALERDRVHEEATRRIASIPGVTGVTACRDAVLVAQHSAHERAGLRDAVAGVQQLADHVCGDAGVPRDDGRPAHRGRLFTARDTAGTPLVFS